MTTFVTPWITLRSWTATLCRSWDRRGVVPGPDRAGLPLELALVVGDDGDVVVVHAMPMRAKYAHLWPKNEGSQEP